MTLMQQIRKVPSNVWVITLVEAQFSKNERQNYKFGTENLFNK